MNGARFTALRDVLGLTERECARLSGWSPGAVRNWCNDTTPVWPPFADWLERRAAEWQADPPPRRRAVAPEPEPSLEQAVRALLAAGRLTPAQARALLWLPEDGSARHRAVPVGIHRRRLPFTPHLTVMNNLAAENLAENATAEGWGAWRATPLGLELRKLVVARQPARQVRETVSAG